MTRTEMKNKIQRQIDRNIESAQRTPRTTAGELAMHHRELGVLYGRIEMLENGKFSEFEEATGNKIEEEG